MLQGVSSTLLRILRIRADCGWKVRKDERDKAYYCCYYYYYYYYYYY